MNFSKAYAQYLSYLRSGYAEDEAILDIALQFNVNSEELKEYVRLMQA